MHSGIFFFSSSFFPFECGDEANMDAWPAKQCLLALTRAVPSEEVVKCWGKTSKSSLKSDASVPTAAIRSGVQSRSPGAEWSWQLSSGAGPQWPLMTMAKEEMEGCGLAYSSGINSVGQQCLVQRIGFLVV